MKVLKLFGGFIGGAVVLLSLIWALLLLARFIECRPDSADVKVMKPMAEKISDYIVKNGIPESLKDIPDLPYGLVGCERVQENFEKCAFYHRKQFEIEMYILGDINIEAYSKTTETGLRYELHKNDNDTHWVLSGKDIAFSSKIDGICNPMRQ